MSSPVPALEGFTEPLKFSADTASGAPAAAGVHVVFDADGVPVYIGSTDNLQRRLRQHLQGHRQSSVLAEQIGAELDRDDRRATTVDIADWLGQRTVVWRMSEDPAELKAQLVAALHPRFNRATGQPTSGVWWVNQGRSFEEELTAGIVFAGSGGPQVAHHLNLRRMRLGDVVLHYRRGAIAAISETVAEAVPATRPYGPIDERDEGWLTRVEYFRLTAPVALAELPERNGSEGPFNTTGSSRVTYSQRTQNSPPGCGNSSWIGGHPAHHGRRVNAGSGCSSRIPSSGTSFSTCRACPRDI
jgi:hypothetical protein